MLTNSTLKLEADKQTVNYTTPWSIGSSSKSSATVSALSYQGELYLVTNAHAVVNSTYLKVKFNQGSTELPVKAVWVDPIMDLAIVKATSAEVEKLIKGKITPIEIDPEFQPKGTEVNAYGYPTGGSGLSFTKGHVSRIEISTVALSGLPGITVQTSAPINPGNSGGPITIKQADKEVCIGIVSQRATSLSNVGYFIPAVTVVKTIETYKKYGKVKAAGFIDHVTVPDISFDYQTLKNPSLRAELGLAETPLGEELKGIYVSKIAQKSCASNILNEGDIIMEIDGHSILANGNVEVSELEHPIHFRYLIQQKQFFDDIKIKVLRKNLGGKLEEHTLTFRLTEQLGQSLLGYKDDKPLKYHVQPSGTNGGFVFSRCTKSLMDTFVTNYNASGRVLADTSNRPSIFNDFEKLSRSESLTEIVVLQNILASEETDGYENFALSRGALCVSHRVIEANGRPIRDLYDLVEILTADPSKPSSILFENGKRLVIAPEADKETKKRLQQRYQIAFFTSPSAAPIDHKPLFDQIQARY
ncbi:Serine protease Do-like HtrA [Legionella massiliensis]|uniref:Serine protease Do-like HtrA n=1 Tax=Legionella massiliensis TaxID=1034943 RepID=A0A078KZ93_9GAMM|nr:S1C family serine protease [Legionella massiliensis]CDZ77048.1 Serine protease Do-like HtrA [Legionella massiliensis]CEE12786.1 Serine protease Do-like HtrA [Legionella massiliensis]